jgi:alcohol dehydrogenase (NADP+)
MDCLLVGAGSIAAEYAAQLSSSTLSLAGVCDSDQARARSFGAEHGCPAFTDLDAALTAIAAPLVLNLTSHAAHAAVTRQALTADRHVYSQKPLALDADVATALLKLAAERDLALGVAPHNEGGPSQRRAARVLGEGRTGDVKLGYAHSHVGRVTEWHDRPQSFLDIGPLYDGAVYPLSLLVSWFGPAAAVRVADSLHCWPDREPQQPSAPTHLEATVEFASGPVIRLTASFYAPHRSREFYGLELHGDDGSLYLRGTGAMDSAVDDVQFGRLGREYTAVPPQTPTQPAHYTDALENLAACVKAGRPARSSGRRGAHVVAICDAIMTADADGGPVPVPDCGVTSERLNAPAVRPPARERQRRETAALRLPPIGFGCSRYRDGEYVERQDSIATALDAGYRLLDSAELYGNEFRIGEVLASPGAPARENLFLMGKAWRTNHQQDKLLSAITGSLAELGIDAFDSYGLHWPEPLAHQEPLERLAEKPIDHQEALTFPENEHGEPATGDISLEAAWGNLETVYERGLTRTLAAINVTRDQLEHILGVASVKPAVVQIERHPYLPQTELVAACHEQGIRVIAHSPLSAPGLLDEPVLNEIAAKHDRSPAGVVLAWNVSEGVVPIPSSTAQSHISDNLAAASERLPPTDLERIDALRDPTATPR